jgi:hypothetical protein
LAALTALTLPACKARAPGESPAIPAVPAASAPIHDGEDVCGLLAPADIAAVLKTTLVASKLPKAGQYGAPRCRYSTVADAAPGGPEVNTALYLADDSSSPMGKYFDEKLEDRRKMYKMFFEPVPGLGDRAMIFGSTIFVLRGRGFFELRAGGFDWNAAQIAPREAAIKLAHLAAARLP